MQLADTPSPQSATLGIHPVAVATKLPLLFKVHKIWSVDSEENH